MEDVVPELLEQVRALFNKQISENEEIKALEQKAKAGSATQLDAQHYSTLLGIECSDALKEVLKVENLPDEKMYWNIAKRIIGGGIKRNHELVNHISAEIQKNIDRENGIGLNAIEPELNEERVHGILEHVCDDSVKLTDAILAERLTEPIITITESFHDEFIKQNAEFRAKAGLETYIVRRMQGNCCKWCQNLAGTYAAGEEPKDVYRRHERCRCQTYFFNKKQKYRQDVWTKQSMKLI